MCFTVHREAVLAAQVAWRTLSQSIINNERRTPQTCWGGFVSLCGLAAWTPSYSVNTRHAEAIVDVAVEFEDGRVVVPRYSEQLLPVSRLPLAFLVLDNKLCWQAERQSQRSLAAVVLAKRSLILPPAVHKTPQTLLWACIILRETNPNSCLDQSIIDSYCTRLDQTNVFTWRMKANNNINTARSTDSVCNILYVLTPAHTDSSFYLWLSCCDRPQGSISVSHFCSCVQIAPSTRVHQGRLKTITTTWLWKITDTSIFAAKKAKGTNVQSNIPSARGCGTSCIAPWGCHYFF